MGETNVILKYRRTNDSWLCPDCDAENQLTQGSCAVCGYRQMGSVAIVRAWTEQDERMPDPSSGGKTFPGHMMTPSASSEISDPGYTPKAESSGGKVFLWIAAIFAIIVFICFVIYSIS